MTSWHACRCSHNWHLCSTSRQIKTRRYENTSALSGFHQRQSSPRDTQQPKQELKSINWQDHHLVANKQHIKCAKNGDRQEQRWRNQACASVWRSRSVRGALRQLKNLKIYQTQPEAHIFLASKWNASVCIEATWSCALNVHFKCRALLMTWATCCLQIYRYMFDELWQGWTYVVQTSAHTRLMYKPCALSKKWIMWLYVCVCVMRTESKLFRVIICTIPPVLSALLSRHHCRQAWILSYKAMTMIITMYHHYLMMAMDVKPCQGNNVYVNWLLQESHPILHRATGRTFNSSSKISLKNFFCRPVMCYTKSWSFKLSASHIDVRHWFNPCCLGSLKKSCRSVEKGDAKHLKTSKVASGISVGKLNPHCHMQSLQYRVRRPQAVQKQSWSHSSKLKPNGHSANARCRRQVGTNLSKSLCWLQAVQILCTNVHQAWQGISEQCSALLCSIYFDLILP